MRDSTVVTSSHELTLIAGLRASYVANKARYFKWGSKETTAGGMAPFFMGCLMVGCVGYAMEYVTVGSKFKSYSRSPSFWNFHENYLFLKRHYKRPLIFYADISLFLNILLFLTSDLFTLSDSTHRIPCHAQAGNS